MILIMQILAVIGIGIVIYATFGLFTSKPEAAQKTKNENQSLPKEELGKEQKIQRLQSRLVELESQLQKSNAEYANTESASKKAKENEAKLLDELKRKDEWLAKAEADLAKIKLENSGLNNKFIAKEKELEAEFTNNVNLNRALNEMKSALAEKEMGSRLKEDKIQAQKHQIDDQLKTIKEHLSTIAEFKRKEENSEWVPKAEFNRLNEEYSELEKELEANQERLKSFAEEITHLRQELQKKVSLAAGGSNPLSPEQVTPEENRHEMEGE